jgi:hypothetical protein
MMISSPPSASAADLTILALSTPTPASFDGQAITIYCGTSVMSLEGKEGTHSLNDNAFDRVLFDFFRHIFCFVLAREIVDGNVAAFRSKSFTYQSSQTPVNVSAVFRIQMSVYIYAYLEAPVTRTFLPLRLYGMSPKLQSSCVKSSLMLE